MDRKKPDIKANSGRPNTINLTVRALDQLLDQLDSPERQAAAKQRKFVRWPFRKEAVELRLSQSGAMVSLRVASRNLSRGGMSALHNNYLHPGTTCEVVLPHPRRGPTLHRGKVVRCIHRSGVVHEVGIAFSEPINARDFAGADPLCNRYSLENVAAADLRGTLVLVSPAPADRMMVKHYVREGSLKVIAFDTEPEAISSFPDADVVVLTSDLPGWDARKSVGAARDAGYAGPIIMLVPDRTPATRAMALSIPSDVFLVRPIQQDTLLAALGEVLLLDRAANTRHASGAEAAGPWLAEGLRELMDSIGSAVESDNAAGIKDFTQKMEQLATSTGLAAVGTAAAALREQAEAGTPVSNMFEPLRRLSGVCEQQVNEILLRRSAA